MCAEAVAARTSADIVEASMAAVFVCETRCEVLGGGERAVADGNLCKAEAESSGEAFQSSLNPWKLGRSPVFVLWCSKLRSLAYCPVGHCRSRKAGSGSLQRRQVRRCWCVRSGYVEALPGNVVRQGRLGYQGALLEVNFLSRRKWREREALERPAVG